jgi:hypothetical protein
MRKLSREYGWAVVGVYAGLTALDFPFCYLLVRTLGTDRIGKLDIFYSGRRYDTILGNGRLTYTPQANGRI